MEIDKDNQICLNMKIKSMLERRCKPNFCKIDGYKRNILFLTLKKDMDVHIISKYLYTT